MSSPFSSSFSIPTYRVELAAASDHCWPPRIAASLRAPVICAAGPDRRSNGVKLSRALQYPTACDDSVTSLNESIAGFQ